MIPSYPRGSCFNQTWIFCTRGCFQRSLNFHAKWFWIKNLLKKINRSHSGPDPIPGVYRLNTFKSTPQYLMILKHIFQHFWSYTFWEENGSGEKKINITFAPPLPMGSWLEQTCVNITWDFFLWRFSFLFMEKVFKDFSLFINM